MGRKFGAGDFELKILLKDKDGDITKKSKIETLGNGFIVVNSQKIKD